MQSKVNKSVANTGKLLTSNIISKFAGILTLGFFSHTLQKIDLAILPVYGIISALSIVIFSFGIFPTFVRTLPRTIREDVEAARSMIFSGGLIILIGTSVFSFIVALGSTLFAKTLFHDEQYSRIIIIMCFGFVFIGIRRIISNVLWAAGRFGTISFLQIIESVSRPCLTIGLFVMFGLKGLVWGLVLNDILYASFGLWFLRDFIWGKVKNRYRWADLIVESLPFYLEGFLMYFKQHGDNWIVATLIGPASMAVYYIAKTVYSTLFMFHESVDKVVTVRIAEEKNKLENWNIIFTNIFHVIVHISVPFIGCIVGILPFAIFIIGGEKYIDAELPAAILCMAILIQLIRIPIGRSVFIIGKPINRLKITIVETAFLLPLLICLTFLWGVIGLAIARLLANLLAGIYGFHLLNKIASVTLPFKELGKALVTSIPSVALLLYGQMVFNNPLSIPILLLMAVCLFLLLTTLLNSHSFYNAAGKILPFKVVDPVRYLARKLTAI